MLRGTARYEVDDSLLDEGSRLSFGGMSTREPLRPSAHPHPLLPHLHSLLSSLNIPLAPSSLAIVTPSLLLTALEALLETRIDDVPDAWRGSWTREHRRGVMGVLVRAMEEVVQGLTRALDGTGASGRLEGWKGGEVDVEQVVRGKEEEVAKLVAGLLKIAEAMGIPALEESFRRVPLTSTPHDFAFPCAATPRLLPSNSTAAPSSALSSQPTPTPSGIFAPRPRHPPRRPHSPPAPPRASASALSASASTSASSFASLHSRHSAASTSLTVPSHPRTASSISSSSSKRAPSLVSELAKSKSGYLSPPPGSPRRQRVRRAASDVGEEKGESTAEFETRKARSTLALMKRLAQERERAVEQARRVEEEPFERDEAEERRWRRGKEKERGDVEDPFFVTNGQSGDEDKHVTSCCEGCGSTMRSSCSRRSDGSHAEAFDDEFSSSASSSSSRPSSPSASSSDPDGRPRARHVPARRNGSPSPATSHANHPPPFSIPLCSCHKRSASSSRHPQRPSTLPPSHRRRASRSSTTSVDPSAAPHPAAPPPPRRTRIARSAASSSAASANGSSNSTHAPLPVAVAAATAGDSAAPTSSKTRTSTKRGAKPGDLSVHGESEVEAFERLRLGHQPATLPQPPPQPAGGALPPPLPSTLPSSAPHTPATPPSHPPPPGAAALSGGEAETPSPYTLMLLAQRDRLREKLAALQRRERDRREAGAEQGIRSVPVFFQEEGVV
ncbi:hypothetical protein JCM6882_008963 [Rhodosporidiobolus microsporus]